MRKIYIQTKTSRQMLLELNNGKLTNFFIEDKKSPRIGDIFSAVVKEIDARLNVAFVNIGFDDLAYMPLKDVKPVQQGERLIVQVEKLSTKSKRITVKTNIQIKNNDLVYLPNEKGIHISKKIPVNIRDNIYHHFKPKKYDGGIIFRTACENMKEDQLANQLEKMINQWKQIKKDHEQHKKVSLLYRQASFWEDYLSKIDLTSIDEIVCDDLAISQKLKAMFKLKGLIITYDRLFQLHKPYSISTLQEMLMKRHVKLKSGAKLTIDRAEALTIIDVDTGSYNKQNAKEKMIENVNEEAAIEIARVIKTRQLSGIILIDFINMSTKKAKNLIIKTLNEELAEDDVPVNIFGFTKLGLLEMTRKRIYSDVYNFFPAIQEQVKHFDFELLTIEEQLLEYHAEQVECVHLEVKEMKAYWLDKMKQLQSDHSFYFSLYVTENTTLQKSFKLYKIGDERWLLQRLKERNIKVDNPF